MGLLVIVLSFSLSGCIMVGSNEAVFEKYCHQFPSDEGCMNDGIPTGINETNSESCQDGYVLQDNICVISNENPIDTVNCELGYHKEDEQCVPDEVDDICEDKLILYNGDCVTTCELPIDDPNYFPCFRECQDGFSCSYHKLVLAAGNNYFESFTMWIHKTDMNSSTEFELHYTLKGETDVFVSTGGEKLWCTPSVVECEELYKSIYTISHTTGEIKYIFNFWYDENWYTKVEGISYEVWNTETNEYDRIDLDLPIFYLEDIYNDD